MRTHVAGSVRALAAFRGHVNAGRGFVDALAVGASVRWANWRHAPAADAWLDRHFQSQTHRANLEQLSSTDISSP